MPPELLAHVFEPFIGGDGGERISRRSIGLGLFIVRRIAEVHGGTAQMTSSRADGTAVKVWLPRARLRLPEPAPAPLPTASI